jgi:hypothetical protein
MNSLTGWQVSGGREARREAEEGRGGGKEGRRREEKEGRGMVLNFGFSRVGRFQECSTTPVVRFLVSGRRIRGGGKGREEGREGKGRRRGGGEGRGSGRGD